MVVVPTFWYSCSCCIVLERGSYDFVNLICYTMSVCGLSLKCLQTYFLFLTTVLCSKMQIFMWKHCFSTTFHRKKVFKKSSIQYLNATNISITLDMHNMYISSYFQFGLAEFVKLFFWWEPFHSAGTVTQKKKKENAIFPVTLCMQFDLFISIIVLYQFWEGMLNLARACFFWHTLTVSNWWL